MCLQFSHWMIGCHGHGQNWSKPALQYYHSIVSIGAFTKRERRFTGIQHKRCSPDCTQFPPGPGHRTLFVQKPSQFPAEHTGLHRQPQVLAHTDNHTHKPSRSYQVPTFTTGSRGNPGYQPAGSGWCSYDGLPGSPSPSLSLRLSVRLQPKS